MLANNENLTLAEKMRLIRYRQCIDQDALALRFGTTKYQYRKFEAGDPVNDELSAKICAYIEDAWVSSASPHELLRIERERAGFTTNRAADVVGYSRSMYMIIEGGGRPIGHAQLFQKAINNNADVECEAAAG